MPRPRKTDVLTDTPLPGLEDEAQDPQPRATRVRAPRTRTVAKKTAGRKPSVRTAAGRIMSKAQMVDKVRVEVRLYLDLMQAGWEMRDPICAQAATPEALDTIAERVVNMIARSDAMLEFATKTGILGDIIALIHAVFPIVSTVWAAHRPGGHGHRSAEEVRGDYQEQYPAYAGVGR